MRTDRVFRPKLHDLERRIVLDHGVSGSALATKLHAAVRVESHAQKLHISARPRSLAGNVASRIQVHFEQFSLDLANSRNLFLSNYLPVAASATTTTAAAQADAVAKETAATTAKATADAKTADSNAAQTALIQANSDAAKAKAVSDIAASVATDAANASKAMPNDANLKAAANAAALDAANKKADSDAKAAIVSLDTAQAATKAQEAADAIALAKSARAEADAAKALALLDAQADVNATVNEQTQKTFETYITQRVGQLSQDIAGDLLLLVATPGGQHKGHRPALIPNTLPAYLNMRLTNPSTAPSNTSLLRQLIAGLPGAKATQSTLSQLAASQTAATQSAKSAIYNGSLLIKFNRSGRAPTH